MSKAENFAIKKYPISIEDIHGHKVDVNLWQRKAYEEGYHQAEKDNELTWEDIRDILKIYDTFTRKKGWVECKTLADGYQEILKQFKERKII